MEYQAPPAGENPIWWPISAQQTTALHSKAQILLYGGASGGGKTDLLVGDAIQEHENPNLRALLIRKSLQEMQQIQDRCRAIYIPLGGWWRDRENSWVFPSGARVRLGYMANDGSIDRYVGNPFTFLGCDESTYMPENQVRNILPWLASTDPAIFCRVRLATNPGNIGAAWHMNVFLRGNCPLCSPEKSVEPGSIYRGSRWLSDNKPVSKTVSFIPARVEDNPLYGQDKIDSLESQTDERQRQLKLGCWCKLEGMYFSFLNESFKQPFATIQEEPWFVHFLSMDYGYAGSAAATGLYFRTMPVAGYPLGRIVKCGEIIERQMGSEDYARHVCETFVARRINGQRCNITACYCDPAMDAHTGQGRSNMELMADVFALYDVPLLKAAKDRIGNAMRLYGALKKGELVITDVAPKTFTSLKTRMHDPDMPGAVLKVKNEDLDDLYDETSYGLNTFLEETTKPRDIAIAQRVAEMREEGMDPHSLMVHSWRLNHETPRDDIPAYMGARRRGPIIRR